MKDNFARWHVLCAFYFKRDWKKILLWVLLLGVFSAGYIPAFEEMAKGQGLIGMYETLKNPAMIFMVGPTPVLSAAEYTLGAMYSHEMLLFCGLFAMIISALHVVGHTRKEEDSGLTEIISSFQVGRQANSLAVIMETLIINLFLSLVIITTMYVLKVDSITIIGIILFGSSVAAAGIIGSVIALVMAQLNQSSAGATGSSLAIIGFLYILRGVTDVSAPKMSIFNPMGWTYLTYPFTENRFSVILLVLIFSIILLIVAFVLEGRRDMGAGILPVKEGRASAKKSLLSLPGLFIRLNKGVIISWLIAYLILGAAYGSIYGDMRSFLEGNKLVARMFTVSGVSIEASFTAIIMLVMIGLSSILPVSIINRLYAEEENLNLSQIYATKVTKSQLYWVSIILSIICAILGILMSVIGLGGTALSVLGDNSIISLMDFLKAGYNFLPAVLFFIGLAATVLGWFPRFGKFIYVYLGYSFAINYFGNMFNLPDWFRKTAILSWLPRLPVDEFDIIVWGVITVISLSLIVLGYHGYINRDRIEGE